MQWAEVIILRSPGGSTKVRSSNVKDMLDNLIRQARHEHIRVFCREKLDSDICFILCHIKEKTKIGGSPLGMRLVVALKELGLVHHTIWIEMEGYSAW